MRLVAASLPVSLPAVGRVPPPVCCAAPPTTGMRVAAIKAELDERQVQWRGVAFEKEELVRLLEEARLAPPSPSPPSAPPPTPAPPPPASAPPPSAAAAADERAEIAGMKVAAIKAELASLGA